MSRLAEYQALKDSFSDLNREINKTEAFVNSERFNQLFPQERAMAAIQLHTMRLLKEVMARRLEIYRNTIYNLKP